MKSKLAFILIILSSILFTSSCTKEETGLTEDEIIQGLKEALKVGTDTSVTTLNKVNGYFGDAALKILLPPEAQVIVDNKDLVPGLSSLIDSMVLKLNRAAEDAAIEAKPIFINAITSMTISDGANILYGNDSAATHYLRQTTYISLKNLFMPKIDASLDKPIIGVSANDMWNTTTSLWNTYANSFIGQIAGHSPVNITLADYTTTKGLQGLFIKVADEEKSIRKDPLARVNDILQKVFGFKQ